MNEEVDKVYGELYSELSKQHDEMKDYLDKVQASVSLPRNLLKRGSIEEIISSQKLIDEKIEKLCNQQPEHLAAVNDGYIQYVPDDIGNINVDEIVHKLGHVDIGNINVDEIVHKLGHVEGMSNLLHDMYITVSTLQRFRFHFHYRYY
jgi:hypothetical protein